MSLIVFLIGLVCALLGVVFFGLSDRHSKTELLGEIVIALGISMIFVAGVILK